MRFTIIAALLLALPAAADVPCPVPTQSNTVILFSGSESACSNTHPYCLVGDAVTFRVRFFAFQVNCAPTIQWTFSDGHTATGPEVTRVITASHPLDVSAQVSNHRGSAHVHAHVQMDDIVERWPMIVERLARTVFRFSTTWSANATWDFGDGRTATGRVIEHRYRSEPRSYTVTITDGGVTHRQTVQVVGERRRAARH
jgi:PKD domain